MKSRLDNCSAADQSLIKGLIKKVFDAEASRLNIITFDRLYSLLEPGQVELIKAVLALDPKDYGFKGPEFGIEEAQPQDLITIPAQTYTRKKEKRSLHPQYLPHATHRAYVTMKQQLKHDTGRDLLVESGYRSPAAQAITFLYYLVFHQFDISRVAKRVAVPGYSQHGTPSAQAIDFMTVDGIPDDSDPEVFENTPEFDWLSRHAAEFGYVLSYPRDNQWGVDYEPWHWQYLPD